MMWVFTQVISQPRVVHVTSRLDEVVEDLHPLRTANISFRKGGEGLPGLQCVLRSFIRKEKDDIDLRLHYSLIGLLPILVVCNVKISEREERRPCRFQAILLYAQG